MRKDEVFHTKKPSVGKKELSEIKNYINVS